MKEGYRFLPSLDEQWIQACRINSEGHALHAIVTNNWFIDLVYKLDDSIFGIVRDEIFKSKFIINSFSVITNYPQIKTFAHEIHRDLRFYTGDVPMMFNIIIMLDDFTKSNGATWILPYSHLVEDKPSDKTFEKHAMQMTGKAGDILIFNSNVWHCAGYNLTDKPRRAIAITVSKSCLKQLMDYPRALGDIYVRDSIRQLLGYHSRVPANMEEWNGPRTYLKDQD